MPATHALAQPPIYHSGLANHKGEAARTVEANAPREAPMLTLYRDGRANFNGAATWLLREAAAIRLLAPTQPRSRWQLLPYCQEEPETVRLTTDRGLLRFSSAALATALYAAQPEGCRSLRLELEPTSGSAFRLVVR